MTKNPEVSWARVCDMIAPKKTFWGLVTFGRIWGSCPSFHWNPNCTLQSMCIRQSHDMLLQIFTSLKQNYIGMPRPTLQGKNCHEKNIIVTNCPSFTSFPGVPCYCLATGCHHHRCRCHCHNEDSNLGIRVTWKHTSKTEPQGQATLPAASGWPSNP